MRPPKGFTSIKDVKGNEKSVNIIGVIVAHKEPRMSKGTDWVWEFEIQDDFNTGLIGSQSSIKCRMFKHRDNLPKNVRTGDIVLIRRFKPNLFQGRIDLIANNHASFGALVFSTDNIPVPELSQAYQLGQRLSHDRVLGIEDPTPDEQIAIVQLKHEASASVQQVQQYATAAQARPPPREKLSLIKDVDFEKYYDIRAEVIKMYDHNSGEVEMWVSDYTENTHVFNYIHPDEAEHGWDAAKSWSGPWGQYTLNIMLWEMNGDWANRNIKVGDYVFLRNVRIKHSRRNHLEGALHQSGTEVNISKLINPTHIREIDDRRRVYEQRFATKRAQWQRGTKRFSPPPQGAPTGPSEPSAAKTSKKAEKKRRNRELKEAEERALQQKEQQWSAARNGTNMNMHAAFPEMKLSTVSEILYTSHRQVSSIDNHTELILPFVNARHRSRVRVVDVWPPKIEDFSHSTRDPRWMDPPELRAKERWEWGFVLLLEDANVPPNTVSEKLRVVVDNQNAQGLLDHNAVNLKENSRVLKALEERLFILWGNMMELKSDLADERALGKTGKKFDFPVETGDSRLQNKAFDCCIEEYGCSVPVSTEHPMGYQRMHKLVHTFIKV